MLLDCLLFSIILIIIQMPYPMLFGTLFVPLHQIHYPELIRLLIVIVNLIFLQIVFGPCQVKCVNYFFKIMNGVLNDLDIRLIIASLQIFLP